jgi:hypothetical protein
MAYRVQAEYPTDVKDYGVRLLECLTVGRDVFSVRMDIKNGAGAEERRMKRNMKISMKVLATARMAAAVFERGNRFSSP